MKTHFLDFRDSSGTHRVPVTESLYRQVMNFWQSNPKFNEKQNYIVRDAKNDQNFTMADFTGRSGKIRKLPPVYHAPLPEPEEVVEKRKKKMRELREKWEKEGRPWAQKVAKPKKI